MPTKINPYNGNLDLVNASGDPGPDSGKFTVNDYTDSDTLTDSDFNQIHRMDSASNKIFTLPSASAANIGKWLILVKKGTGNLTLTPNGLDAIEDSGSSITCTETITYAKTKLVVESAGAWGVYETLGTWS